MRGNVRGVHEMTLCKRNPAAFVVYMGDTVPCETHVILRGVRKRHDKIFMAYMRDTVPFL